MACAVIELVDELAENGLHQQQKCSKKEVAGSPSFGAWLPVSLPVGEKVGAAGHLASRNPRISAQNASLLALGHEKTHPW